MNAELLFTEFESDEKNTSPEVYALNIISGGCRIYGYLLSPDKRIPAPFPAVIMSHGFPGLPQTTTWSLRL